MISPNSVSETAVPSSSATHRPNYSPIPNPATAHDAELVRRFKAGDEDAFVEIVARHREKMFAIAQSHLRNHADAEEIAQDAFIRAYRGLGRFRGDSSLASWLHTIVFNLSRNRCGYFFRRHRHQTRSFDCIVNYDTDTTVGDLIASDNPTPDREVANREFHDNVMACIDKLSRRQREILILRNRMNQSYEEIALSLGLSRGTVKSRIARARKSLRKLLAQTYGKIESAPSPVLAWFEPSRPAGLLVAACG
jgi:RNA polymerase sigma-70 factor (ECF subfamily)